MKRKRNRLRKNVRNDKQFTFIISSIAIAAVASSNAQQIIQINPNQFLLTPVNLNANGFTLNNNGAISVTGINSTSVNSTASVIEINNTGSIFGDSRAVNISNGQNIEVTNSGTISGTGDQRNGTIHIDSSAFDISIDNFANGVIDTGILNQGSAITLGVNGTASLEINNEGQIIGQGSADSDTNLAGDGIRIGNVGDTGSAEISITNSGDIQSTSLNGNTAAIRVVDGVDLVGSINSEGTITGSMNGIYIGNSNHANGVIDNSGTIQSASRAIHIDGDGLTLNNSGSIIGSNSQRNGTIFVAGTANNITINNTSGLIDAGQSTDNNVTISGAGISVESAGETTLNIANNGEIHGRGIENHISTFAGDGIRLGNFGDNGIINGNIVNTGIISSESISGTTAAIRVMDGVGFQGLLNNSGQITGVWNGVYFGQGDHTGSIFNNSGTVSAESSTVSIAGTGLTLNNSGSIIGSNSQRNGTVFIDGIADNITINNESEGIIDAGEDNVGAGISVNVGGAADGITTLDISNDGSITGRYNINSSDNFAGDGIRIGNITAGTVEGTILNDGTITTDSTIGNTAGIRIVDNVSFQGLIENNGEITGSQNGIYFGNANHAGGELINAGTISSSSRALNIGGTGLTFNNSGNVLGTGNQRNGTLYVSDTADDYTINNEETGVIDAGEGNLGSAIATGIGSATDGVNNLEITNDGTITGRGNGDSATTSAGDGIRIGNIGDSGTAEGSIINNGTISAESTSGNVAAIRIVDNVDFQGTIENTGTIQGAANGVHLGNGDYTGSAVNNSGTISSDSRAVNIDGTGLTLNNTGDILGTNDQRNGTVYVNGTFNNVTINNEADALIDAGSGNNGSGLSIEVDADSVVHNAEVNNSGTIAGRGTGSAAGVHVFGSGVNSFSGVDITNNTGGSITSENEVAILIQNLTSTGSIVNNGNISGATAAIDTTTSVGDIDITQGNGSLTGGVFTGSGDDLLLVSGNADLNGNINLGSGNDLVYITGSANLDGNIDLDAGNDNVIVNQGASLSVAGITAIDNSNFTVNGQLNLFDADDLINVEGDVVLGSNSTVIIDNSEINTSGTRNLIIASGTLTDNGISFDPGSNLIFDSELESTEQVLRLNVSVTDFSDNIQNDQIASFADAFVGAIAAGSMNTEFNSIAGSLGRLDNYETLETELVSLLPSTNIGVTRELYETHAHLFSIVENRLRTPLLTNDIWIDVFGRVSEREGDEGLTNDGYSASNSGFTLGVDKQFNDNFTGGVALTYANIDVDVDRIGNESSSTDYLGFQLYGQLEGGNAFLTGQLAYGNGSLESKRTTSFGNIESDSDISQLSIKARAGYNIGTGLTKFTPFASFQHGSTSQDSFTENGGLGLSVNPDDVNASEVGVGVSVITPIRVDSFASNFRLQAGYYFDLSEETRDLDAAVNGQNFSLYGEPADSGSFEIEAGLDIFASSTAVISLGYLGEFSSDFNGHNGNLGFRYSF